MNTLLILAPLLLGVAMATYDPYTNLDKWYQMQLLASAINDYLPNEQPLVGDETGLDEEIPYQYWPQFEDVMPEVESPVDEAKAEAEQQTIYNDPMFSEAHPRDQEHLEHSNLHGHQSMTGGTAEGAHNEKQVKSDKLPAYCNPPNPCPVGKTAAENCVENFENTAENNERLLSQQECPCDTEHMFKCPAGSKTVSTKAQDAADSQQQMAFNKVMGELAQMEAEGENFENNPSISSTKKRMTIMAKKSPHIIHKRSENMDTNPFFQGERMHTAAKKDPKFGQKAFNDKRNMMFEI